MPPLRIEFFTTSPAADTTRVRQFTTCESMTVFAAVMVQGPVYVVRVPLGPVLERPGKQPPLPSGPSGTFGVETAHEPGATVGVGVGVGVTVGVELGLTVALGVALGVAVTVAVVVAVTVAVTVEAGGFGTLQTTVIFCEAPLSALTTAGFAVHVAVVVAA
jgi:hypothetical protein